MAIYDKANNKTESSDNTLKLSDNTLKSSDNTLKSSDNTLKSSDNTLKSSDNTLKSSDNTLKLSNNTTNSIDNTTNSSSIINNTAQLQEKWSKKWNDAKVFEAVPDSSKPKFFCTFPYPYVNSRLHIGHLYTLMRVEALARYKRLKGFNVLFSQGWHATGSPIISAAKRVQEREETQIKLLKDLGITDKEIKKFEDPKYWVDYFVPYAEKDFKGMGITVDWRRSFVTTSLNPWYDKFIRWQFNKLKSKNYVIKGKFPVVWCTKCKNAVTDHSRATGEGETAQEFTLLKFEFGNKYIVAATLRPETVFGQTNLWVGPNNEYVVAKVNDEIWIISEDCANKLKDQERKVEIIDKIKGYELIGKIAKAPGIKREVIILPSFFCDPNKGTGIVTSVPSDAPDDYIGLMDLQNDSVTCKKYGLNIELLKKIQPISIIDTPGLGEMAAERVCMDMKIKSQHEREKLEEAKKLVYKKGFYEGIMNKNCGKYAGWKVEKAKDKVKEELIKNNEAELFYELTGKVVCRCLTPSMVKIVDDQWFIDYGNEEWKTQAHKCLNEMKLYPESVREQFNYVINWLHKWACTREEGLGTKLPWDEKWLIESLSDSTIYMAYYTIAHLIKQIPPENIDDFLFDYIFLGKGKLGDLGENYAEHKEIIEKMKPEFNYWYPLDFRNSGKDLVQNHLTFFIFNHTAIFPENKWPKGIGVNGWVTIDGQKMSKSLGNVIPLHEMASKFGADASRLTILSGGEGLDDPNWDTNLATSLKMKLAQLPEFCNEHYNKGRNETNVVDEWMESKLNEIIIDTDKAMEQTLFRTAIQSCYFELQAYIKWYLKRAEIPNKKIMNSLIEAQLIMLAPFTPFVCEEAWEKIGKKGVISQAAWPNLDEKKVNPELNLKEDFIKEVIDDTKSVLGIVKITPKKIILFVSEDWKYSMLKEMSKLMEKTRNPGEIIKALMQTEELKKHGKDISSIIPKLIKSGKLPRYVSDAETEYKFLVSNKAFFEKEFNCVFEIVKASETKEQKEIEEQRETKEQKERKEQKASQAMAGKPAILVA